MKITIMQIGQLGVSLVLAVPALYIVLSNGYTPAGKELGDCDVGDDSGLLAERQTVIDSFCGSGGLLVSSTAQIEIFYQGRKRTPHWAVVMLSTLGISCVNRNMPVLRFKQAGDILTTPTPLTRFVNVAHILFWVCF